MNILKKEGGFTQIDIAISVVVLMLFVTLIASLFYNSFISSTQANRDAEATAYLSRILQSIDLLDYDKLDDENEGIIAKINLMDSSKLSASSGETFDTADFTTPYKAKVKIENYIPENAQLDENNNPIYEDLIKIVTIKISYKNKKGNPIQAQRIKTKEMLFTDEMGITPKLLNGMNPISYEDINQITTQYASNWFDYSKKIVAEITLNDVILDSNGKVSNNDNEKGSRYIYIPRFAYMNTIENGENKTKIKFLNEDNTCKDGSEVNVNIESGTIENDKYYLPSIFTQNNIEIEGIWVGKYLTRQNTDVDFNQSQIYVSDKDQSLNIWNNLVDKQSEYDKMIANNNKYGLPSETIIKTADSQLENVLQKLSDSGDDEYKFIADAIEEDENDYLGSFRIIIY